MLFLNSTTVFTNLDNETSEIFVNSSSNNDAKLSCITLKLFGIVSLALYGLSLPIDVLILLRIVCKRKLRTHKSIFAVALILFNLIGLFGDLLIVSLSNFNCK